MNLILILMLLTLTSCGTGVGTKTEQNAPTTTGSGFTGKIDVGGATQYETRSEHYTIKTSFPVSMPLEKLISENYSTEVSNEK